MRNKQEITAGDNSTNVQGTEVSITQYNGINYKDAREIALDVFKNNFYQLSGEAAELASKRVEEFTDELIEKIQTKHQELLESMKDPDMQYVIYSAQKEYARTGDKDLSNILLDIIVDRATIKERSLIQIVLNESIEIAPKLTITQLDILTLIFVIKYARRLDVGNIHLFSEFFESDILPFMSQIPEGSSYFQHLEYVGCGSISSLGNNIEEIFANNYQGLFSKGFSKEDFNKVIKGSKVNDEILIPCLNNNKLFQIKALTDQGIIRRCHALGEGEHITDKLIELQNTHLLSSDEISKLLIENNPKIKDLIELWNGTDFKYMTLTSVGIALAHANLRRKVSTSTKYDLSVWIK